MAGLRGKSAWLAAGKQSAKGAAAAAAKHMWPFAGGTVGPRRNFERLSETDDQRDQGAAYVTQSGVEGQPEVFVRDANIDFWLGAALGAVADGGVDPNYEHTVTPASALPYITVWRMIGDVLYEQFTDVMVNELVIRAEAGQPLRAQVGLLGLKPERLTSDPSGSWAGVSLANGPVYTYNEATVTLGGAATSLVSSFELTISNNIELQQTDDVIPYDMVPGTLEVSIAWDMIFESLDEYNSFHYGGASGTVIDHNIYETSVEFAFSKGANNEISFALDKIAYEEFPVEPQPEGGPVTVSLRASAQRPDPGDPIITAVVKNQSATTF